MEGELWRLSEVRELPEGWRWADAATLAGEVALPSAFQAFRGFLPKA